METAISLDRISKRFILQTERARSFYDKFLNTFRDVMRRHKPYGRHAFWALRDVSFDVYPGELLSFVGANGGGKSTTLKLIAGILRPTTGRLVVNGRVSAMLELGTGFHPDLTGRENIYLSAAILGLSKAEVEENLKAIIESLLFASDTPLTVDKIKSTNPSAKAWLTDRGTSLGYGNPEIVTHSY